MLLISGLILVALGILLEGVSLFCLYRMWTRGRLLTNVKYEVIDRILHYPKLVFFPVGLTWIAIFWFALKWYQAVGFFAVAYFGWIVLTTFLALTIVKRHAHKGHRAVPVPPISREEIPELEPLAGPKARVRARPVQFGKDKKE